MNLDTTTKFVCIPGIEIPEPDILRKKVARWANRRGFGISYRVQGSRVEAWLAAPDTRQHNRAVRYLSRIIERHIQQQHRTT